MPPSRLLVAAAFALAPVAAHAQTVITPEDSVFKGDYLIVGAGAAVVPSYQGSNDSSVVPAAGVLGNIRGIGINPRAAGVALDFVPEPHDARIAFTLGPVVRYRSNRTHGIKDPVVKKLGELDAVFEGGVAVGVTVHRLLTRYDSLSVGSDFRWDISGKGSGMIVTPGVSYFTPLSEAVVVGARVGVEFVDDRYAVYNYDVSTAGSVASGLPQYHAHGGLHNINAGGFVAYDLSGDFRDGGVAVGAGAIWTKLHGSAARTPITSIRGSANQWVFGAGLAYTF